MHLKTLTLRGFKSFASATTLALQPGITCVVGPNGSGKSNVVDALAWVMGEQGARALRGSNMADVIFAGTSGRAALGRAQVDLTIDNADGLLDIEYSEVTISRTLFRGGGSEYSINGSPVRLLDVQELLSDTGMGRQMHVIVGQGQLDAILSSTPEERRGFIEEAAGVLKHRRRKERALKKLADIGCESRARPRPDGRDPSPAEAVGPPGAHCSGALPSSRRACATRRRVCSRTTWRRPSRAWLLSKPRTSRPRSDAPRWRLRSPRRACRCRPSRKLSVPPRPRSSRRRRTGSR